SAPPITVSGITAVPSLLTNNINRVVVFNVKSVSTVGAMTNVSLNLSQVGGPASVKMTNISGATMFRYPYNVRAGLGSETKTIPIIAQDGNGNVSSGNNATLIVANAPSGIIVTNISAAPAAVSNNLPRVVVINLKSKEISVGSITNVSLNLTGMGGPAAAKM